MIKGEARASVLQVIRVKRLDNREDIGAQLMAFQFLRVTRIGQHFGDLCQNCTSVDQGESTVLINDLPSIITDDTSLVLAR